MDPQSYVFNAEEEEKKAQDSTEEIPEGIQLFTVNNLYFNKFNPNPSRKKRETDFVWWFKAVFTHHESGLLITRMDNGNFVDDDPHSRNWASVLKLERVDQPQLNTHPQFDEFMTGIGAPKYIPDNSKPKAYRFWSIDPNGKAIFTGYNEDPAGPLGLPVMLKIIHREVPVFEGKRNSKGEILKEDVRGFKRNVLVPSLDEDGRQLKQILPFIECTQIPDGMENLFGANDLRWPKVYELPEEYKDIRGTYHKYEEEQKSSGGYSYDEDIKGNSSKDEIDW